MPSEPATGQQLYHVEALAPVVAVKVVGAAILGIYALQIGLYNAGVIEVGAAVAGFVGVGGGVLGWARWRGVSWHRLGLRWPKPAFAIAGVLIGLSAWYVNLWIVSRIQPPGDSSGLQQTIEQTPLAITIVALAVLPALTEELVFRGVLARALATRFPAVHAIGFSAAIFAMYHLLPAQMISTFCLALALGYLTLRAASAVPAMIAHLLNNTVALVVARNEVPGFTAWVDLHQYSMLAMTALVLVAGIALAASRGAA